MRGVSRTAVGSLFKQQRSVVVFVSKSFSCYRTLLHHSTHSFAVGFCRESSCLRLVASWSQEGVTLEVSVCERSRILSDHDDSCRWIIINRSRTGFTEFSNTEVMNFDSKTAEAIWFEPDVVRLKI